jgi:hypothetical protein
MVSTPVPAPRIKMDLVGLGLLIVAVICLVELLRALDRANLLTLELLKAMAGGAVGLFLAVVGFQIVISYLPGFNGKPLLPLKKVETKPQ